MGPLYPRPANKPPGGPPLHNRSLQNGLHVDLEGYDPDLAALASEKPNVPIGACLTRLVCKASVILGRIVAYKNIKPMPTSADGAQTRLGEFHELQSALACFWLSLPSYVHNITEVPPENASQTFWLLIVAHTCSAIIFYITEVDRRGPEVPIFQPNGRILSVPINP
ncbi:hypothetical protein N7536_010847 [Penicillium majusculum]|nr:hypothetical protein N7536_010847 [Penicillium majusculum]